MLIGLRNAMMAGTEKLTPALYTGVADLVTIYRDRNTLPPEVSAGGILNLYNESLNVGRGYATLPFTTPAWNKPHTVVAMFDFKKISANAGLLGSVGSGDGFTPFWFLQGHFVSFVKNVGWPISWNGGSNNAGNGPSTNSSILVAFTFDGTNRYKFFTSTGTGGWMNTATKTSSATCPGGNTLQLGSNRGQDTAFAGLVDLNFCYIEYDGSLLWAGTEGAFDRVISTVGMPMP